MNQPTVDKPENAPAFPQVDVPHCMGEPVQPVFQGLSMRDYFAAAALHNHPCNCYEYDNVAGYCYAVADAMMRARLK